MTSLASCVWFLAKRDNTVAAPCSRWRFNPSGSFLYKTAKSSSLVVNGCTVSSSFAVAAAKSCKPARPDAPIYIKDFSMSVMFGTSSCAILALLVSAKRDAVAGLVWASVSKLIEPMLACFLTSCDISIATLVGTPTRRATRCISAYSSGLVSTAPT